MSPVATTALRMGTPQGVANSLMSPKAFRAECGRMYDEIVAMVEDDENAVELRGSKWAEGQVLMYSTMDADIKMSNENADKGKGKEAADAAAPSSRSGALVGRRGRDQARTQARPRRGRNL
jgi:hypothetical protein